METSSGRPRSGRGVRTRQGALQRLLRRLLPQSRLRSAAGPPTPPKPVRGRAAAATPPAHAGRTDTDPDQGERGRPGEGGPRFGAGAPRCGILALSLSFVSAPLVNYAVPLFPLVRSFPVARQRPDARVSATRRVPGASWARAGWRLSACARSSSYTRNEVHAAQSSVRGHCFHWAMRTDSLPGWTFRVDRVGRTV